MSTRSVLAIQTGDTWKGRYCHSDGYPGHMLRVLHELVARDGLEVVRTMLTETHTGWDQITPSRPDLTGVTINPADTYETYPYGTLASTAVEWRDYFEKRMPGRHVNVPGYGIADTSPTWWITQDDTDTDCQWAYVLADKHILVYSSPDEWVLHGRVRYDEPLDSDMVRFLECGRNYEICAHYANYHFSDAPPSISTGTWLGLNPPTENDVHELIVEATGKRIAVGLGGSRGSAQDSADHWASRAYWWLAINRGRDSVRAYRIVKAGYKLEPQYSAVVATSAGEVVLPPGHLFPN